jgi:broad specificity phosphatase PhoE
MGMDSDNDHRVAFIRHGQSVHNAAYSEGLEPPPDLIDAPLSALGRSQAQGLQRKIERMDFGVVVTSPLTRAIETTLILFARSSARVVVTSLLHEFVAHPCDIGRAGARLKSDFPQLDFSGFKDGAYDQTTFDNRKFLPEDPEQFKRRCHDFLAWLLAEYSEPVAVVGHSSFFTYLLGVQLPNCGVKYASRSRLALIKAGMDADATNA